MVVGRVAGRQRTALARKMVVYVVATASVLSAGCGVRGVEPGNARLGIAYVGAWGWIEEDPVAQWRLRTPELGIDLKTIVNGRVGSAFRLTRFMKLGVGVFTDRSPIDRIRVTRVATTDIDFYGVHLGFLFSNR